MMKKISWIFFCMALCSGYTSVWAGSDYRLPKGVLGARVLSINRTHNFLVLDIGTEEGITEGTTLNLLKDGESIAIVQVMRAKERVSACEIKHIQPNLVLQEGDVYSLTVSKEVYRPRVLPKETVKQPKKESLFKKIASLGRGKKKKKDTLIAFFPMMVHIEARKEIVNYYLNEILRDMNFIITSSDVKEGMFTAHRFLPIPLWQEILADFKGAVEYRAVYDINTIDDESGITLKLDVRLLYTDRKGKTREKILKQSSQAAKDALELVKRVKTKSETITRER